MEEKFYFIVYSYKNKKRQTNQLIQTLKKEHPIDWQIRCNNDYGDEGTYTVINWKELSKSEYEKYEGLIG